MMTASPQFKTHRLDDPVATCGSRLYAICSQHGLFSDPPDGHVPGEMWGVWAHPIKLLDGFWFGVSDARSAEPTWLTHAERCGVHPTHVEFEYRLGPLRVTRRDFVPDATEGMIVALTVRADRPFEGFFHALFRSDLRPAWLGEQAGLRDGRDRAAIDPARGCCVFTDEENPWLCAVGADIAPLTIAVDEPWAVAATQGRGATVRFTHALCLDEHAAEWTIRFAIVGSASALADAAGAPARLLEQHPALFAAKQAQCQAILEVSQIVTPDEQLNQAIAWSKLINQMFVRDVPAIGCGLGAGLPEYPWWFSIDVGYAALPMLQCGQFELVRDALRLLRAQSERHNAAEPGRVIHELTTTGVVFNKGNMVEVPIFTRAVHQYWLWSGDDAFLAEMYPFCKAGLLDYALGQHDPDGDLCPSGRSVVETVEMHAGFETIDVAAYMSDALGRLADMSRALGDAALADALAEKSAALGQGIRQGWWMEDEGLFADVRASVGEVQRVLSDLDRHIAEQDWLTLDQQRAVETARRLFAPGLLREAQRDVDLPWLLRHWVVLCPLETGIATPEQAKRSLDRLQSAEFSNAWGMYLHPERQDVMSINTGLLALSAARYGLVDDALSIIAKLVRAFGYRTPGAVSEALPDAWCFLQLWSNVGLVAPVVECFLGIQPRAAERTLVVRPRLPSAWAWAEVKRLRVGDAYFDIRVERAGTSYRVTTSGGEGWRVVLEIVPA
jgi:glycogen debranching enzyme